MRLWRFAAARATGASHLKADLPCQDRLVCLTLAGGTLVAAVADGAGSAAMAERGADIAIEAVVRLLYAAVQDGETAFEAMLTAAASTARNNVLAVAREMGVETRDLACTLLIAVSGPMGGAALQIGDGVIVAREDDNQWRWIFWPQHGEYVNTTKFLTDEDAEGAFQVASFTGAVADIALMTDGLEPLALNYSSQSVYEPFFVGMFDPLIRAEGSDEITTVSDALADFLSSRRVTDRTDDDLSFIMATRRDPLTVP